MIATSADQAALLNERTQDILDNRSKDVRHTTYSLLSGIDEAEIARMIADKELTEEKIAKVIAESELSSERSTAIKGI